MSEELDDIGRETAAMMRTMLQIATLVALKTRERGQKEAEARAKLTEARAKESRELQIREARDSKSKDPRNLELARMVDKTVPTKGVSLEKDRFAAQAEASRMAATASAQAKPLIRYDSAERRNAIAAHLTRLGIAPELAAVRMLIEVGQGQPPEEAIRVRDAATRAAATRGREQEARGVERVRQ